MYSLLFYPSFMSKIIPKLERDCNSHTDVKMDALNSQGKWNFWIIFSTIEVSGSARMPSGCNIWEVFSTSSIISALLLSYILVHLFWTSIHSFYSVYPMPFLNENATKTILNSYQSHGQASFVLLRTNKWVEPNLRFCEVWESSLTHFWRSHGLLN